MDTSAPIIKSGLSSSIGLTWNSSGEGIVGISFGGLVGFGVGELVGGGIGELVDIGSNVGLVVVRVWVGTETVSVGFWSGLHADTRETMTIVVAKIIFQDFISSCLFCALRPRPVLCGMQGNIHKSEACCFGLL